MLKLEEAAQDILDFFKAFITEADATDAYLYQRFSQSVMSINEKDGRKCYKNESKNYNGDFSIRSYISWRV